MKKSFRKRAITGGGGSNFILKLSVTAGAAWGSLSGSVFTGTREVAVIREQEREEISPPGSPIANFRRTFSSFSLCPYSCLYVTHGKLSLWSYLMGVHWTWTRCTECINVQHGKRDSMHGEELVGMVNEAHFSWHTRSHLQTLQE